MFSQLVEDLSFPNDVSIFQENVQLILSLPSRVIGHDNDKIIDEYIIGFVMKVS